MAGMYYRQSLANCVFNTLSDGREVAWRVEFFLGEIHLTAWIRWKGDDLFSAAGGRVIGFDEEELIRGFLDLGAMWDRPIGAGQPTWRQVYDDGAMYRSTDGQQYTGAQGIGHGIHDWLVVNTTRACEAATDTKWVQQWLLPLCQQFLSQIIAGAVPTPPPPPVPIPTYAPLEIGRIIDLQTLCIAHFYRMTGTTVGNTVKIGLKPVP